MVWKKKLPGNTLKNAQMWMPRGEGTVCSVWIMSWEQALPQCAGCSSLLGKEKTFSPPSMQEGSAAPWEMVQHPTQITLGTGNEQGKYHLQPRKKLHPKTLVCCLVL